MTTGERRWVDTICWLFRLEYRERDSFLIQKHVYRYEFEEIYSKAFIQNQAVNGQ